MDALVEMHTINHLSTELTRFCELPNLPSYRLKISYYKEDISEQVIAVETLKYLSQFCT
jgi:hypothetical protein